MTALHGWMVCACALNHDSGAGKLVHYSHQGETSMYGGGKLLTLAGMGPSVRTMTVLQVLPSPEKPGAATESGGARNGVLTLAGDTWSLSMGSLTCSQQKVRWCSGGEQLWSTTTIGSIAPKLFLL